MEAFLYGLTTPAMLKEKLTNVVGQEEAKKILCTAIWKKLEYGNFKKTNILLVGPSGSGKTYLVQSLAKIVGLPVVVIDSSTLTATGWKGNEVENIFEQLMEAAGGDISQAERGIVVLDEIDKKGERKYLDFDCCGIGVQHNLLRLLEDGVINLRDGRSLATDKIMFVACGAFQKVAKRLQARQQGLQSPKAKGIGMNLVTTPVAIPPKPESLGPVKLTREAIMQYGGIIPELIGRFDIVVNLEPLSEAHILQILKNEKTGVLQEYRELFALNGYKLELEEELLKAIVKEAVAKGLGARGLRAVLDKLLLKALFEVASRTADNVEEVDKPELKINAQGLKVKSLGSQAFA